MNCTNCGNALAPGTTSCPNCGTPVVQQPVVSPAPAPVAPASVAEPVQPQMMPAGMPQPSPVPVQQQPAPQPAVVGGQVPTPNKSGSKKSLLIVLILVLLAAGIGGYFIYDNIQEKKAEEKREEKKKEEEKNKDDDYKDYKDYEAEIKKNVSVKLSKTLADGSILLLVENKSTRVAGVDVELEFYDASGTIMGTHTTYVDVAPNSERYDIVSKYSTKEGYDTFKLNISTIDYTDIMDAKTVKSNDLIKNETEEEIILQYKNTTEYKMDFEIVCIFYSNNEIVYVDSDTDYVDGGSNANVEIDLYYLEDITYDRYEIYAYAEYDTYDG